MESLARQFEKPRGFLGKLAGMIMFFENKKINRWSIEKLQINKGDRILEIGYGPGYGIKTMLKRHKHIFVDGIDLSTKMFEEASKRNKEGIQSGKVLLHTGDVADYQPGACYDRILSVNNYPLWDEPLLSLKHLFDLLNSNGKVVLTVQPREEWATDETAKELGVKMQQDLLKTGFKRSEISFKKVRPTLTVCVTARKE